jgi:penicillin-binding protein 2
MPSRNTIARFCALLMSMLMVWQPIGATGTKTTRRTTASIRAARRTTVRPSARSAASSKPAASSKSAASKKRRSSRYANSVPTFGDSTKDDVTEFDDPVVRAAAVQALGRYNGSVVAIDPVTGRILSVVNQKLAFSSGFIPCSTIKPTIALAALQEGIITRDSMLRVAPRKYMNLTEAMAHSNNTFFEELGRRMGFDTVAKYAHLMGLGELAGYNIPEEQAGAVPAAPPERGGVARMSSFGEGIQMTPLQLGSLVASLANGGTMYYLQYPRSEEALRDFEPRVKHQLDISAYLSDIREGMQAAVLYGTARSGYNQEGEQLLGKTGTCSDSGSRLGWFVSYADQENPKIVLVVLLRGHSHKDEGPYAALIAGHILQTLKGRNFFATQRTPGSGSVASAPSVQR